MCGIAGMVDYSGVKDLVPATEKMLRAISHRGPDESGIYSSHAASLGNVRLSIVDIVGGQQPLSDLTSRYWITFNGEIFNYKELRTDLEKRGFLFRTHSDTEVLVQLYSIYGRSCLRMLNGQFAFAIWDKLKEELFFARDRIGIRPFFYNITEGRFSFASEIKALFTQHNIRREFDRERLAQIFTFWSAITPGTAFIGVEELSPGHYGIFSRSGLKTESWWNLRFDNFHDSTSLPVAMDRFNELFSDAVRIRLRADVEVAAYLSGGIDSSATVASIKDIEPGILNTFSIGFKDKDFDESRYQKLAVDYFKTRHNTYTCSAEEIAGSFPKVIWHSEIPLTRTAPTPMLLLSKLVRDNNIKVVVTGEGSDELLAGYDIFKETIIRRFWAKEPKSVLRPLLLKKLYPYIPGIAQANIRSIKMFFSYKLEDVDDPFYSHLLRWNNSNQIKKHFSDSLKAETNGISPMKALLEKLPEGFSSWDPLSKSQWLETSVFMSGYLLSSQGDRMSMANSVEGRYPFLDYRIIEFCNNLRPDLKLNGLTEKYLLKKLLKNRIPEEIIARAKQPYRAPAGNVFLSDSAPEYVHEMLSEEMIRKADVFRYSSIGPLLSGIRSRGSSSEMDDMLLTSVISTHLLYRQFIENRHEGLVNRPLTNLRIIEDTKHHAEILI